MSDAIEPLEPVRVKRGAHRPLGSKDKIQSRSHWRDALRTATLRIEPKSGRRYIDLVAEACVEAALNGDMSAVAEIGNRLDGRTVTIEGNPDAPITLISRIERVIVDVAAADGGVTVIAPKPSDERSTS